MNHPLLTDTEEVVLQLLKRKMMNHPLLTDTEEAVLQLLQQVSRLEAEKDKLQERIKELEWMLTEHD
jgi:hypothetical protein